MQQTQASSEVLYAPSWIDRFFDWIEQLPGAYSWFYLALAVGLVLLSIPIHLLDQGTLYIGSYFYVSIIGPYALWMLHSLRYSMAKALGAIYPVLNVSPEAYQQTIYRLTHSPARAVWVLSVVSIGLWAAIYLGPTLAQKVSWFSKLADVLTSFLSMLAFGLVLYQAPRSFLLIREILDQQVKVRLLGHQPLHTITAVFARLTLQTSLVLLISLFTVSSDLTSLVLNLVPTLVCVAALIGTVQGVHERLLTEKRERTLEIGQRLDELSGFLHQAIDQRNFAEVDGANKSLSALQNELNLLEKAPTWPWNPDTPRVLFTAIVLPILVWLAQRILSRVGL